MPRGGRRSGKSGRAYTNRSDLNTAVPTGLPYGERQVREQQLQTMPLPTVRNAPTGPTGQPGVGATMNRPQPVPLDAPSQRPDEPLTHGLSTGPGAGPSALGLPPDPVSNLRQIYEQYPNEDLRALLEDMENRAVR